jgi:arylsulfatase A-like enzyme
LSLPATQEPEDPAGGEHEAASSGHAFSMVWLPDAKPQWGKKFQIVSLRTARWKLIFNITREVYELYDLAADPREKHDLVAKEIVVFEQLREILDAWLAGQEAGAGDVPTTGLDAELEARLKALGYM